MALRLGRRASPATPRMLRRRRRSPTRSAALGEGAQHRSVDEREQEAGRLWIRLESAARQDLEQQAVDLLVVGLDHRLQVGMPAGLQIQFVEREQVVRLHWLGTGRSGGDDQQDRPNHLLRAGKDWWQSVDRGLRASKPPLGEEPHRPLDQLGEGDEVVGGGSRGKSGSLRDASVADRGDALLGHEVGRGVRERFAPTSAPMRRSTPGVRGRRHGVSAPRCRRAGARRLRRSPVRWR